MSIKVPAGKSLTPVPNSERLGGELPEHYATKVEADNAQASADTAQITADEATLIALGAR